MILVHYDDQDWKATGRWVSFVLLVEVIMSPPIPCLHNAETESPFAEVRDATAHGPEKRTKVPRASKENTRAFASSTEDWLQPVALSCHLSVSAFTCTT